ncbi:hypothetical protein FJT64_002015 [Amphibalanus amphitrite]|uniref:Uncharacterized protein n=1 Tax=Amphibalanus amphitrite TaxID=1232801 RepID=A0A6A4WT97_AMPAM|nr:hypothetical protein FJT64_002015 [Amphibalanus amphitrite]
MASTRLCLLALASLVCLAHGRPPVNLLSVLPAGLSRLLRPWTARPDPSRGPDRMESLRTVSTDPGHLDDGLDFNERRRFLSQPDREFSVYNPDAPPLSDSRSVRRWGAARQEHGDPWRPARPPAPRHDAWSRGWGARRPVSRASVRWGSR